MSAFIRKHYKIITVTLASITVVTPIVVFILTNQPKRAELSLLIDPVSDCKWALDNDERHVFSVNFSLSNEGARTAIIKEFELSVMYELPSGDFSGRSATFSNFMNVWNLSNPPIIENEVRGLYLSMYVYPSLAVDSTGEIVQVGDYQPDQFKISVIYDDGIDDTVRSERVYDLD
jgi:hypothetical protein